MSEIADNKWEVQASKPPIMNFAGFVQMGLMGSFALIFLWLIFGSVRGLVTPKEEGGDWVEKMGSGQKPAAEAVAPAEGT